MSKFKKEEGKRGEEIAASFLIKEGYQIIERNFRIKNGEVDIIARDKDTLVFIEVKTRSSLKYGMPYEAINYYKLNSLVRVAQYYKLFHSNLPDLLRIDAISIILSEKGEPLEVEHIKNIYTS